MKVSTAIYNSFNFTIKNKQIAFFVYSINLIFSLIVFAPFLYILIPKIQIIEDFIKQPEKILDSLYLFYTLYKGDIFFFVIEGIALLFLLFTINTFISGGIFASIIIDKFDAGLFFKGAWKNFFQFFILNLLSLAFLIFVIYLIFNYKDINVFFQSKNIINIQLFKKISIIILLLFFVFPVILYSKSHLVFKPNSSVFCSVKMAITQYKFSFFKILIINILYGLFVFFVNFGVFGLFKFKCQNFISVIILFIGFQIVVFFKIFIKIWFCTVYCKLFSNDYLILKERKIENNE